MKVNELDLFSAADSEGDQGPIVCTQCGSAEDLILEALGPAVSSRTGVVALEYSCGACESFFAHTSSVVTATEFLEQPLHTHEMLQQGDTYLHCGEPMTEGELQISAVTVEDEDLVGAPAVGVEMTVLKCPCGFQMSIPTS